LPATSAPDDAAQQRLLFAARIYVAQTLLHLPNFLATRTDKRFDDSPHALKKGAVPVHAGLHLVDTSSREVSIRNEREKRAPSNRLVSQGEFGSAVGLVLNDILKGTVTWSHWEETAAGPAAVFHYSVPKSASHYEIILPLPQQLDPLVSEAVTQPHLANFPFDASIIDTKPAYRGSFWLDPSTGTVLRITMEADPNDIAPYLTAAIMVKYGPVRIGDGIFICPLSGVTLSTIAANTLATAGGDAPIRWLNETLFTGYHRFAATTRILTDAEAPH
jgi:hypothetical protein